MAERMKKPTNLGIPTKLLLMNLTIIVMLGGILITIFLSFQKIEQLVTTIIARNVAKVMENTHTGEELLSTFVELITSLFYGQEGGEQASLERLEQITNQLTEEGEYPELRDSLQQFSQNLASLLTTSKRLDSILQNFRGMEDDFLFELEILADLLAEKRETLAREDPNSPEIPQLKQIQALNTGYRDTFLNITMLVTDLQRQKASMISVEAEEPTASKHPIMEQLEFLELRLQTLTSAHSEITEQGEVLKKIVHGYKEAVEQFQQTLSDFQKLLYNVNTAKEQTLATLRAINTQTTQAVKVLQDDINAQIFHSRQIAGSLAGIILLALLLATYSAFRMVKPLKHLAHAARSIAKGNINIHLMQPRSHDEVGSLTREFHTMILYVREMAEIATRISIGDLRTTIVPRSESDILGNAFQRMSAYLNEMAAAATAIAAGDLRQEVQPKAEYDVLGIAFEQMKLLRQTVSQIMNGAERLKKASEELWEISAEMASGSEQTSQQVQVVSENSQQISRGMNDVSTAVEELAASAREISHSANDVMNAITTAVEIAKTTEASMARLTKDSEEIGEIIAVITGITQQTNLLALNATIEAARAGESGKGFAVVASEVKELAQETSHSAGNITQKIEAIQLSSQEVIKAILNLSQVITHAHTLSKTIALAVNEQTAAADEISVNMTDAVRGSDKITRAITGVAEVTQHTSEQAGRVQEASQELTLFAEQLRQLVEKFSI